MDFRNLSRKQLQALCKKNKIPANMTNVAMADALQALGSERVPETPMALTRADEQETQQTTEEEEDKCKPLATPSSHESPAKVPGTLAPDTCTPDARRNVETPVMQESGEKTGAGRLKRRRTSQYSSTKKEEVTTTGYGVFLRRSKRSVTAAKKEQEVKRDIAGGDGDPSEQNRDLDAKPMEVKPFNLMVSISSLHPCTTDSEAKLEMPNGTPSPPLDDDKSLEAGGSQCPQRGELEIKGDESQDVLMEGIIDHQKDLSNAIDESQEASMEGIINHEKDLSNAVDEDSPIRGLVTTEENKGKVTEQGSNEVLETHMLQELGDGDSSHQLPDEPDIVLIDLEIKNLSNVMDEDSPIGGLETTEGNKGKVTEQGSNEVMRTHLLQELGDGDSRHQLPDEPEIVLADLEIKNLLPPSPPELEFPSPDSSMDFNGSHLAKGNDGPIDNQMLVEPKSIAEAAVCSRHWQISPLEKNLDGGDPIGEPTPHHQLDDETKDDNLVEIGEAVTVHFSAELESSVADEEGQIGDQKLREPESLVLEVEPKCITETTICSSHWQISSLEKNLDCGDSGDEPIPHHELDDETKDNNLVEEEETNMVHFSPELEANAANEDRLISNQMLGKPVSIDLEAAPSSPQKVFYSESSSGAAVSPAKATDLMNCDSHLNSKILSETGASTGDIDNVLIGEPENTLEATFCSLDSSLLSSESGKPRNKPSAQTTREESNKMGTSEGVCCSNLLVRGVEDKVKLVANKPSQNVYYSRLSMRKLRELYKEKARSSKKKNNELRYSGLSMRKLRALYKEKASNKEQQG